MLVILHIYEKITEYEYSNKTMKQTHTNAGAVGRCLSGIQRLQRKPSGRC